MATAQMIRSCPLTGWPGRFECGGTSRCIPDGRCCSNKPEEGSPMHPARNADPHRHPPSCDIQERELVMASALKPQATGPDGPSALRGDALVSAARHRSGPCWLNWAAGPRPERSWPPAVRVGGPGPATSATGGASVALD